MPRQSLRQPRSRDRNAVEPLRFEALEQRWLLAAAPLAQSPIAVDYDSFETDSILVRFREELVCRYGPCAAWQPFAAPLETRLGKAFFFVPGLHQVELPDGLDVASALDAYRGDPNVLYAEPNYRVFATQTPNDPRYAELWGLNNAGQTGGTIDVDVDAPEAWDVTTGGNTLIAVIDTGVDYTHEDLAANMWTNPGEAPGDGIDNDGNGFIDDVHGYDFANDDGDPMDDQGHGTHVAGTIGAVGNNGIGVTGVNWNARIMAVKFLDSGGSGSTADAIDAISYATAQGAKISNNSWGGYEPFSQAMNDAIAAAGAAGQVFVAGAGNGNFLGFGQDNDVNPFYPASYNLDNIISVAAVDHNDERAVFSNFGATSVDLAAPGVDILSTRPGNAYAQLSGTSMATPHVAGVVSLVWQQHPEWTTTQVIHQVLSTVDPVDAMQGISVTGGRLNAASAVGNVVPPPPPPPSGTLPVMEDFTDGAAEFFAVHDGVWSVAGGRFRAEPAPDAISTVRISDPLPANLEIQATVNVDLESADFFSNGLIVFDFQNPSDFKFAGAYARNDQWVIGHQSGGVWFTDASLSEVIDAGVDYALQLVIENNGEATLLVNGAGKVTHTFSAPLNDGDVGLAAWNAFAWFDDEAVDVYVPPPSAVLPVIEDFDDGAADFFTVRMGDWEVLSGRYRAAPAADAISTLRIADTLPADLQFNATVNADLETGTFFSNALLVFDYVDNTHFKFAGAYARSDKWVIGRRSGGSWILDATLVEAVDAEVDYGLQLIISDGAEVTLLVDGVPKVSHTYTASVVGGELGLATSNALAWFDDVSMAATVPLPPPQPTTLPATEDFEDGAAEAFEVRDGLWSFIGGKYRAAPSPDAISTLHTTDPLPANLQISATVNADPESGSLYSNALVVFDYRSNTDFKFAGAYARTNKWVIGHKSGASWITDASLFETVAAGVDHDLDLLIENDSTVTLLVGGVTKVSQTFVGPVTDGQVGLGAWNAFATFDDVFVGQFVPPPVGRLPIAEDFEDGAAELFDVRDGLWSVQAGRYRAEPGPNAITTLRIDEALPADFQVQATVNADLETGSFYSNALIVFDYQSNTNFKFAGAYAKADRWVIGYRSGASWFTSSWRNEAIAAGVDYELTLDIEADSRVTLLVGGVAKVTRTYTASVIDGDVGLAVWNGFAWFDNVAVQATGAATASAQPDAVSTLDKAAWVFDRLGRGEMLAEIADRLPAGGGEIDPTNMNQADSAQFDQFAAAQTRRRAVSYRLTDSRTRLFDRLATFGPSSRQATESLFSSLADDDESGVF